MAKRKKKIERGWLSKLLKHTDMPDTERHKGGYPPSWKSRPEKKRRKS